MDPLIARAQNGDTAAFERLYREHAGRVYALCLRLAGAADASVIVELGADGGVDDDRYFDYSMKVLSLRSVRVVQGAPSARRINNALRAMASAASQ